MRILILLVLMACWPGEDSGKLSAATTEKSFLQTPAFTNGLDAIETEPFTSFPVRFVCCKQKKQSAGHYQHPDGTVSRSFRQQRVFIAPGNRTAAWFHSRNRPIQLLLIFPQHYFW